MGPQESLRASVLFGVSRCSRLTLFSAPDLGPFSKELLFYKTTILAVGPVTAAGVFIALVTSHV